MAKSLRDAWTGSSTDWEQPSTFCAGHFPGGWFAVGAETERQGFGFLEPFEFFAEGGLQPHQQSAHLRAFKGAGFPPRVGI